MLNHQADSHTCTHALMTAPDSAPEIADATAGGLPFTLLFSGLLVPIVRMRVGIPQIGD